MMGQYTSSNAQFNGMSHSTRSTLHPDQLLGIGYWQAANAWSAMANHDWIAKTTTYQGTVTSALNTAFSLYTNYDQYGRVLLHS